MTTINLSRDEFDFLIDFLTETPCSECSAEHGEMLLASSAEVDEAKAKKLGEKLKQFEIVIEEKT